VTYRVDVPGGGLQVTWRTDGHVVLTGPAEVVARGEMSWTG
jgi:diaminopimelate epimerase